MFSYLSPEQRVRADHPLRAIRRHDRTLSPSCRPASRGCIRTSVGRRFRPSRSICRTAALLCWWGEPPYQLTVSVGALEWFARQRFTNYDAVHTEFDALIKAEPRIRSNAVAEHLHIS